MKKAFLFAALLFALTGANGAVLFDNGKTDWQIVIPVKADAAEKYAAKELQSTLKKISGADFAIINSDEAGAGQIIIGSLVTSPAVKKMEKALALKKKQYRNDFSQNR